MGIDRLLSTLPVEVMERLRQRYQDSSPLLLRYLARNDLVKPLSMQGHVTDLYDVMKSDDEVNELYDRVFHDLLAEMSRDSSVTAHAARLLLVAKHLERVGDYVANICFDTHCRHYVR